jgi:hypothetical protein
MDVESCDEAHCLTQGKKRSMHRAGRVQNEQYTIFRSRFHRKSLPECRSCHAPVHRGEEVCPWCGANRTKPVTGVTQQLPKLPAPVPWFDHYTRLMIGLLLTLLQASVWLWLWPLPHLAATDRGGEPHFNLFYYAVVIALGATICLHCRWTLQLGIALVALLMCWMLRAVMA